MISKIDTHRNILYVQVQLNKKHRPIEVERVRLLKVYRRIPAVGGVSPFSSKKTL